jgi:tRNA-modifying protein YgfZ
MADAPASWMALPRDVVAVTGPDALTYLQSQLSQELRELAVGASTWSFVLEPNGKVTSLCRVTRTGETAFELDVDAGWGSDLLARVNRFKIRVRAEVELRPAVGALTPSDEVALERIVAGWPAMGAEIVPGETIPAETGLTDVAVSFTKGCYPGQELVERMDSRAAAPPRSLHLRTVSPGTSAGDPVVVGGREIGRVTSVVGDQALVLVKRGADGGAAS